MRLLGLPGFLETQLPHPTKDIFEKYFWACSTVQKMSFYFRLEEMKLPSGMGYVTTINKIPWTFSFSFVLLTPLSMYEEVFESWL